MIRNLKLSNQLLQLPPLVHEHSHKTFATKIVKKLLSEKFFLCMAVLISRRGESKGKIEETHMNRWQIVSNN